MQHKRMKRRKKKTTDERKRKYTEIKKKRTLGHKKGKAVLNIPFRKVVFPHLFDPMQHMGIFMKKFGRKPLTNFPLRPFYRICYHKACKDLRKDKKKKSNGNKRWEMKSTFFSLFFLFDFFVVNVPPFLCIFSFFSLSMFSSFWSDCQRKKEKRKIEKKGNAFFSSLPFFLFFFVLTVHKFSEILCILTASVVLSWWQKAKSLFICSSK